MTYPLIVETFRCTEPAVTPPVPGDDDGFDYIQESPATQWSIVHGLGRYVSVTVYAADGELIHPSIRRISINQILITHATPQSGAARIE